MHKVVDCDYQKSKTSEDQMKVIDEYCDDAHHHLKISEKITNEINDINIQKEKDANENEKKRDDEEESVNPEIIKLCTDVDDFKQNEMRNSEEKLND